MRENVIQNKSFTFARIKIIQNKIALVKLKEKSQKIN